MNDAVGIKIRQFFAKYPSRYADEGEIIIQNYISPKDVIYLISGRVKQYDVDSNGTEIVVNSFKPSDVFPMNPIFNEIKNTYFYESTTAIEFKRAPINDVIGFLKDNQDVCYELLGYLYSYVNDIQRRMAYMMRGSARSRTIFEILSECRRFGRLQKNGSFIVDIREDELANQTGLARETVNREISGLKHLGIISINYKGLTVHNLKRLNQELGVNI